MTQEIIDSRLKRLSYSSLTTLHSCPRKFELSRCMDTERESTVTFAFGHAVGAGVQSLVLGLSMHDTIWNMFLAWDTDLLDEEPKDKKSFWHAIHAIQKFATISSVLLAGYEIAMIADKDGELIPAYELSFNITLLDGFIYVGYVDLVLRHIETGQLMVLELKTTKFSNVDEATYKNSAQAIGYSIILDSIVTDHQLSDYKVMYLVYKSTAQEFEPLMFPKSATQRAMWIQQIILDMELIAKYSENNLFPMYGESCFSFFRQCEYFGQCTLSNQYLITPATKPPDNKTYTINISLADVIDKQLERYEDSYGES
jgi:PD-(D/E)XK nuclease superfamily